MPRKLKALNDQMWGAPRQAKDSQEQPRRKKRRKKGQVPAKITFGIIDPLQSSNGRLMWIVPSRIFPSHVKPEFECAIARFSADEFSDLKVDLVLIEFLILAWRA